MYLFILVCLIVYLLYFRFGEHYSVFEMPKGLSQDKLYNTVLELKDSLHDSQLKEQKCQIQLQALKNNIHVSNTNASIQSKFLEKIYNPLAPPENIYPNGNFNSRGYDGYQQFQMLGYLSGSQGQFPVFGRYKYPGKTDKMEYYTINDSRGRIKIPFKTTNYNELYDGDTIVIPELGGEFTFKKYNDEGLRYNPYIL